MKQLLRFTLIALSCSFIIPGCDKNNDDDGYYIEATINGQHWRGTTDNGFIATNASEAMRVDVSGLTTGSYTFFTAPAIGGSQVVLPGVVHLAYMDATAIDSKLTLRWSSMFETNVKHYEIERALRSDPNTFFTMGQVNAQGTSTTQVNYTFNTFGAEPTPSLNGYYFRIKVVKLDNSWIYSNVQLIGGIRYSGLPMISFMKNGRVYYCLDNNQNQLTITSAHTNGDGPRKGTFSFRYKDENGNIINVTNGKFHLGAL